MTAGLVVDGVRIAGREVDFAATAGTVVAVHGGPGEVLSAVLDCVAGLRRPDAGQVLLDGTPVVPRRVAAMQRPVQLFPELTAAENVAVPLLARGSSAEPARIEQALAAVDLAPTSRHNLVEQLSGGQQQRVALARALVVQADLVCLDEPVSELDETTAATVRGALRATAEEGRIVVIATADRSLADRCDQVVELRR